MKTSDILSLLDAFNRVYVDTSLTNGEKAAIGNEILIQLPASQFVPHPAAINAVYRSISDRVDLLEAPVGTSETGRPKGPKEPGKSLRKTSADA